MRKNSLRFILAIPLISIFTQIIFAQDYEPVVCDSAAVYKGSPLYHGLENDIWDKIEDSLSGEIDPSLRTKLNDLADEILVLTKAPGITIAAGIPGTGIW